jgi:hypothetical protein
LNRNALGLMATVLACGGPVAANAATITLEPVYLGSTTSTIAPTNAGAQPDVDWTQASSRDGSLRHWFAVVATFAGAAGEDFRSLAFDVVTGTNLQGINAAGSTSSVSPAKFRPAVGTGSTSGASIYSFSGDNANDLEAILLQQTDAFSANEHQLAESGSAQFAAPFTLGYFTLALTDNYQGATSVTMQMTAGANFDYYTNNQAGKSSTSVTTSSGFTGLTYVIPAVPEPATGLLTLAGVAALLRRRGRSD